MPRISLSKTKRKNFKILLRLIFLRWYKKCILFLVGFGILTILCYRRSSSLSSSSSSSSSSLRGGIRSSSSSSSNAQYNNIALRKPESRPDKAKWMNMKRAAMSEELGCKDNDEEEEEEVIRPVHSPEIWIGMREAYISIVGQEKATVASSLPSEDVESSFKTAFQIPFEIRQSPGMGRGIFTLSGVKKGQIIYDFSQTAQYRYSNEFAEFLRIIKPDLACDVLMWSYVQDLSDGYTKEMSKEYGSLRIMTDLDPGSFCNDGGISHGNMAWIIKEVEAEVEVEKSATNRKTTPIIGRYDTVKAAPLVALRDIDAGEELLCIYSQFSEGLHRMIE
jgi:hypothetical protein